MRTALLSIALLAATVAGCGDSGPAKFRVTGLVTFDGQPVATGEIIFRDAHGSFAGRIVDGRYELQATAGEKRVEIIATRETTTGAAASGEGPVVSQMYIPARYNGSTELSADVIAGDSNQFDYPLEP